jgi:hypothetical protein
VLTPRQWITRAPVSALLIILALCIVALNPIGYIGGGGDDWHYLNAAECWASNGPCLPHDHWSARWPLVAPLAAAISTFGESRISVSLVPIGYAILSLILFAHLLVRLFGRTAALLAGCALLLTPAFAMLISKPNADMVELCFILAAAAAWIEAASTGRKAAAFVAGVALGLAFQTRETSAAVLAVAGLAWLFLPRERKLLALWCVPGFFAPLLAEMAMYWTTTGDPLGRLRLAFGHTQIASTELSASVDTSRSPLFNPEFIAGWQPSNGIRLHWIADPLLNLLTHPQIGLTLSGAILLLLSLGRSGAIERPALRHVLIGLGAAASMALLLIYALAIDPKPRMFLPLACAAAAGVGVLLPAAFRSREGKVLACIGCAIFLVRSLVVIAAAPNVTGAERVAGDWIQHRQGSVSVDETTRRHLALVPRARALPVDDPSRPFYLTVAWGGCTGRGVVAAEYSFRQDEPALARLTRAAGLGLAHSDSYALCLLQRR